MSDTPRLGNGVEQWHDEHGARLPVAQTIAEEVVKDRAWRKTVKAARAGHPTRTIERSFDGPRTEERPYRNRIAEEAAQREFQEAFRE